MRLLHLLHWQVDSLAPVFTWEAQFLYHTHTHTHIKWVVLVSTSDTELLGGWR